MSQENPNGYLSRNGGQAIVVLVSLAIVTVLHYGTPTDSSMLPLHDLWRRLYYVPIILGSFRFGLRGGVAAALLVTLVYAPHVLLQWASAAHSDQYLEMLMFWVIGITTGLLAEELQRKRAETQVAYDRLSESFERAREAERLAAMGQLSAALSHEIRNPLASIKGSLPILLEAVPEDDSRREFVDVVRKEITRLEDLTTQFLEYARPPHPTWVADSLNDITRGVARLVHKQAERARVSIECELDEELGLCDMDSNRIRQVVLNLALNAIQAMGNGGMLRLTTRRDGDSICLDVEDDGPGLSAEAREHLFEPFFTTKENGTGLGLAVVYQWVQRHGGRIEVGGSASGGARFTLSLPRERPVMGGETDD
jgi:two-component system, NtrC family, sensor histidine kinase HydH